MKLGLHLRVRDTQHSQSSPGEDRVSFSIALLLARVNLAIEFDGQAPLQTAEVDDEPADRVLSPELEAVQTPDTQRLPQQLLSHGLPAAKLTRHRHKPAMEVIGHTP